MSAAPVEGGQAAVRPDARPAPAKPTSFWLIAPVVALAAFMEVLDISIANVALRHIAGDLSAGQDESTWVLTSYLITNAIVLPASGWLSIVLGRKRFFLGCIAGFAVSSLLCGLAPNLATLIVFRALQGLTGGGLQPGAQAILSDAAPPAKRGMAFALYGMAVVFAPAIGPTLGGWITDSFSWRWVFLINVPVGVILTFLIVALVADPPDLIAERQRRLREGIRVDYIGFGLLALGLGALQVVLDRGQQDDWFSSSFITAFAVASGLGIVFFVVWELFQRDPIVDIRLLGERNFAIANILMLMLGFILLGSTVLIPQLVQTLFGYTATEAGLVISPGGFAIMLLLPVVGRLVGTVDVRFLIATGLVISSAALYHLGSFSLQADYSAFMWARIYQTLGLAFLFIPINTVAFVGLPRGKTSLGSAIINLSRNIGGSFGISLAVTVLARESQRHQHYLVEHVTPTDPAYLARVDQLSRLLEQKGHAADAALRIAQALVYRTVQDHASMLAYLDDFRLLALVFILLVPLVFFLQKPGGGPAPPAH
ncbi:MAG TPA: DHA2 family efflux MFS transporter permease subunit [Geminicoccaceae bacterium]|nr:DHA2 family efflux MFS transporter permease subunit [Geminicoccaceae bacterium]